MDTNKKRLFFIHLLTAMYNFSNSALYYESPNEFGQHYGLIDHRLSEFSKDTPAQFSLYSAILFFVAVLAYSNQKSYAFHIEKATGKQNRALRYEEMPLLYSPKPAPKPSKFDLATSLVSSLYKASVAASSLAALLKNTMGPEWAIGASIVCSPGNFAAQFAIFAAPIVKKYNLHIRNKWLRWGLVHALTLFYNIPNAALYFNAGDEFLHHIKLLDHRLIDHREHWEYLPLVFLIAGTGFLLFSTQRSYSKKIADIFTDPLQDQHSVDSQNENDRWNMLRNKAQPFFQFEARVTSFYKAVITYISLVGALYTFTDSFAAGFVFSTLCFSGNLYAQYSILKPEPSPLEKENALLDSTTALSF